MTYEWLFIQFVGFLAWIILVLSYYQKNTNKILEFHIAATVLYCFHFVFLGAFNAVMVCVLEIVVNYLYYKTDSDLWIFLGSIPFFLLGCFVTYKSWVDILPTAASIIDGFALINKRKIVLIGTIIAYAFWVYYDYQVGSWAGVITDSILILSNLGILIFHYNIFNKDVDEAIILKTDDSFIKK